MVRSSTLRADPLGCREQRSRVGRAMPHEYSVVARRIWVDADHALTIQVLREIGDQPILPHGDEPAWARVP